MASFSDCPAIYLLILVLADIFGECVHFSLSADMVTLVRHKADVKVNVYAKKWGKGFPS